MTLELQPADAERLILAKTKGTISLAMRSLTDFRRREDRTPTAFENLLPQARPTPKKPEPPTEPLATTEVPVPVPALTSALGAAGAVPPSASVPAPPVPAPVKPPEIKVRVFRGDKQEDVPVAK